MSRSPSPTLGRSRRRVNGRGRILERGVRPLAIGLALALVVFVTTWPWSTWVGHPHWGNIRWLPWTLVVKPWEPLANVLLFMPLGAALQWSPTGDRRRLAAGVAILLSLAVEGFQLYTHTRVPAVPDVFVNTLGGWLGAQTVLVMTSGVADPSVD
jgi:glycopeptide antibiotics resistance protein